MNQDLVTLARPEKSPVWYSGRGKKILLQGKYTFKSSLAYFSIDKGPGTPFSKNIIY